VAEQRAKLARLKAAGRDTYDVERDLELFKDSLSPYGLKPGKVLGAGAEYSFEQAGQYRSARRVRVLTSSGEGIGNCLAVAWVAWLRPTARRQAEIFLRRAPLERFSGVLDSILAFAVPLR
jgi:hypothetical protein